VVYELKFLVTEPFSMLYMHQ